MRATTLIIETEVDIHSNKFGWLCEMWKYLCIILSYHECTLNLCIPIWIALLHDNASPSEVD